MKNDGNYISINIKIIYKTFNRVTLDYDVRCVYITTVHGDRLEVGADMWYLWCDDYLITSGDTRDLHAIHNYVHKDYDGTWNDIWLDYTCIVCRLQS